MIEELIGKVVVVEADGIVYKGKLVEVAEEEVYLEAESGWIVVPSEKISSINEAE